MRQDEVALECRSVGRVDLDARQFAEPGIDPVDGGAPGRNPCDKLCGAVHRPARRLSQPGRPALSPYLFQERQ